MNGHLDVAGVFRKNGLSANISVTSGVLDFGGAVGELNAAGSQPVPLRGGDAIPLTGFGAVVQGVAGFGHRGVGAGQFPQAFGRGGAVGRQLPRAVNGILSERARLGFLPGAREA